MLGSQQSSVHYQKDYNFHSQVQIQWMKLTKNQFPAFDFHVVLSVLDAIGEVDEKADCKKVFTPLLLNDFVMFT